MIFTLYFSEINLFSNPLYFLISNKKLLKNMSDSKEITPKELGEKA